VKAGHAPVGYEYSDANISMFTALASSLRVRLSSLTNTQGLPQYRLTYIGFAELKHACPIG